MWAIGHDAAQLTEVTMATKRKTTSKKRAPVRRRTPKKAAPRTRGIQPSDCQIESLPAIAAEASQRIVDEGGCIVGSYYEPLGRNPLLLAALPIDSVEPTPFQRDLSDAHHKRLSEVIDRTGLFLDPVIAITAPEKGFWTPNGRHRLEALRRLGAKSIIALVVPKREIAWQILALNTEKAHNLRERALEVIRIYRGLIEEDGSRTEKDFAFYLEDPALVTLGMCYEKRGNFAGGAYHSILRRLMEFSEESLRKAIRSHEDYAEQLFELDGLVAEVVDKLKERGLVSPYLRAFVVARINPLRWIKDEPPPLEQVLKTMRERANKFNVEKIKPQDLARSGGVPDSEA
jgi:ParB family transcriptional regulator, chromosome partitioning protein